MRGYWEAPQSQTMLEANGSDPSALRPSGFAKLRGALDLVRGRESLRLYYKNLRFDIFYRPSIWLDLAGLEKLQRRIVNITYDSCGKHPTKGLYVDARLMHNKLIGICSSGDVDCGFIAMACLGAHNGRQILHTGPAFCSRRQQGIISLLFNFCYGYFMLKNRLRRIYTTTITHVPQAFGQMVRSFQNVYPNADPRSVPDRFHMEVRDILLRTYVREIEPDYVFDPRDGFILKSFRLQKDGSMVPFPHTPENVPKHRNPSYNERCLGLIDYSRGDALIMVGEVTAISYVKLCSRVLKYG